MFIIFFLALFCGFGFSEIDFQKTEDDIVNVVKLIFEENEIVPLPLKNQIQSDSTIIVGHSSLLLPKSNYIIKTASHNEIQIKGFDQIFLHFIEDWVRIYAIDYCANKITMKLDVILGDIIVMAGELVFEKKNNLWIADKIIMKEGSKEFFLRGGGFLDWNGVGN